MAETSYFTVVCMSVMASVTVDLLKRAVKRKENT